MKKNLKEQIANRAVESFLSVGYEQTTLRAIAQDLGIAVGNVNYYYPKKEDIVREYHNLVMKTFVPKMLAKEHADDPWINYFMTEYGFLHFITFDEPTATLYRSFVNVPSLREFYILRHQELFMSFFSNPPFTETDAMNSTVGMCYLEFGLVAQLSLQEHFDFDASMRSIFAARLLFLSMNPDLYQNTMHKSIELAKNVVPELSTFFWRQKDETAPDS